jgi:hypothetical protein
MKKPDLGRLIILGFVGLFLFVAAYILLDALGIWPRLPAALAQVLNFAAGLVLVAALGAHLLLAAGRLPAPDGPNRRG